MSQTTKKTPADYRLLRRIKGPITAFKLLRLRKDGTLGPLFINKKQVIPIGRWMKAESHPTKGFALRPGWHTTATTEAPHLSMKGRVWCEVQIANFRELIRPAIQGGTWWLAEKMKVVRRINASPT